MQTELTNGDIQLRLATAADADEIWRILQYAIQRRKADGSTQWQDGYPNTTTVKQDIEKGWGHLLIRNNSVIAYGALIFDYEPAYEKIEGAWLTKDRFLVVHRVAVHKDVAGSGIATSFFKEIEAFAKTNKVFSIKVDTNFDNIPMLKILKRLGYVYCGKVYFRGGARMAFEKVLTAD